MRALSPLLAAALLTVRCTPDIGTDPVPAVMEFDPNSSPPRVSEPSFVVVSPLTGKIDLALGGIEVPADCQNQTATSQAQCEFNQYLESLDGFPSVAGARTPVSAELDTATATVPDNVAVVEARTQRPIVDVTVGFDPAGRYLQVAPKKSWPTGGFVWLGVRGYDAGVRAGGQVVVASVVYNLLKREESLTCGATSAASIAETCPYLGLLSQQMSPEAARASLVRLEPLRLAMEGLGGWRLMEGVGGIAKADAAMLWGFPVHSNPVIDLDPKVGLVPRVVAADEIRLALNGDLDPATVQAGGIGQTGTVYFLNLNALATGNLAGGFPAVTASFASGEITVKGASAFERGQTYGVFVTRGAKSPAGKALVPPPISVLLMARGRLTGDDGKSTVSSVPDADAFLLEAGRQQLAALLDNPTFVAFTQLRREDLAFLFAFPLVTP